jgi:uncharacterized cupredoxin-like copper-binding protein
MRRYMTILFGMFVVVSLLGLAAGCGGGGGGKETEKTATAPAEKPQEPVTIQMGDFFFKPAKVSLPAGTVEISAPNVGKVVHEIVVFETDMNPADFPVSGSKVDEAALEKKGAKVHLEHTIISTARPKERDEIAAEPGRTAKATYEFTPGNYVMICNIPGHYQAGMYGTITVK